MYIGLMSGTSMDAIDAVIVEFTDILTIHATYNLKLPHTIKTKLLTLNNSKNALIEYGQLDIKFGQLFATACLEILKIVNLDYKNIKAIGSHGQTVYHLPTGEYPFSLQIGDPNLIAALTHITTVADFRRYDIAVGGQGAPLVPAFHKAYMQHPNIMRVIINIGGIANITILPPAPSETIFGFDTGPGNALMDEWIFKNKQALYDKNGEWAATGQLNQALLTLMLQDPYFSQPIPKSTGREYFNLTWLENKLNQYNQSIKPKDLQATLLALTTYSIVNSITTYAQNAQEILVCGGGAHNLMLMNQLQILLPNCKVSTTDSIGIPVDWVEAVAFAWLAKQRLENIPANAPSVTGASRKVILGGIYSGV